MKTFLPLIVLAVLTIKSAPAQTHYGTSAGTVGQYHSYFGYFAGNAALSTSTGNSFFGNSSGRVSTSGNDNTGSGYSSLRLNTSGKNNTAVGSESLYNNTTADNNTAVGFQALHAVQFTDGNTAVGAFALNNNTGEENTAAGYHALNNNEIGNNNCAFGSAALNSSFEGSFNSAFGAHAIAGGEPHLPWNASYNSAFGAYARGTHYSYTNYTVLGYNAQATASNQVRIGNTAVTSIGGQVSWTTLSDGRFKRDIRRDVAGLDFINQLNPVSYTVDKDALNTFLGVPENLRIPAAGTDQNLRQVGFVAQEVDAIVKAGQYVFTGIEVPKNENDPYTIRYAEFVVPLVKAVQELTARTNAQEERISKLIEVLHQYDPNLALEQANSTVATLYQNNPNPFSTSTQIQMKLSDATMQANIIVYSLEGKQLKDIQVNSRGNTSVNIAGSELSPGMYLYTLIADGKVIDTKRLVLTK